MTKNTIYVNGREELLATMPRLAGGETVILADGDYGSLSISRSSYSEAVTFVAENQKGAKFSSITLRDSNGYHFDGIEAEWFTGHYNFRDLSIINSKIGGTLSLRGGDGIVVHNSDIGGGVGGKIQPHAVRFMDVSNFELTGNYLHEVTVDVLNITGDSHHGLIEGNLIYDVISEPGIHPDLFQMFGAKGKTPHDLVIRNNVAIDDVGTGNQAAQGFFFTDYQGVGYQNILVENNIISSGAVNSLTIRGATENVKFLDNHVISNANGGAGTIRLGLNNEGLTVEGNLARQWYIENEGHGATIGDNHLYGDADITDIIRGSDRNDWKSYLPAAKSEAAFGSRYGAQDLLKLLLEGSAPSVDTSATTILPTTVLSHDDRITMRGLNDGRHKVIEHSDGLSLPEGTIELSFSTSTNHWTRTILSKHNASETPGISLSVTRGRLELEIEDSAGTKTIALKEDMENQKKYDISLSFNGHRVEAWLDGNLVGSVASDFSFEQNRDPLLIGGRNEAIVGADVDLSSPFHGRIDKIAIHDKAMSASQLEAFKAGQPVVVPANTTPPVRDAVSTVLSHAALITMRGLDDGRHKVIEHSQVLAIDAGTIEVTFSTSTNHWSRSIFSKESSGQGHEFGLTVTRGRLELFFGGETGLQRHVLKDGMLNGQDYQFQLSFDGKTVNAWLDGLNVGSFASSFTLADSTNPLLIGGRNNAAPGEPVEIFEPFHGRISNLAIHDEAMDPQELAQYKADALEAKGVPTAPAEAASSQSLLHWIQEMTKDGIDLDEFVLNEDGQIIDISLEARTIESQPVFTMDDTLVFRGFQGAGEIVEHESSMELATGVITAKFSTSKTDYERTVFSKESGEMGDDIAVFVKGGRLHIEVEDGSKKGVISAPVEAGAYYDLKIGFDGRTVEAWLNGKHSGSMASAFNLANNAEALVIGAGNKGLRGEVDVIASYHGRIHEVSFYQEELTNSGELPVSFIDLGDLNLVPTQWSDLY
ncbi:right-handed parallel beta-helix repeat-containing protein [Cereibacter sp. SYSU M97828]|nr:right-handed parallel beta-helix repeat-containing protein [Cereibacter flavus]